MKTVLGWFLVIAILAAGCSANPTGAPLPTADPLEPTAHATATFALPPLKTASPPAKSTPQATPQATPKQGMTPGQVRGTRVDFWYPGNGDVEDEYAAQIAEFNRSNIWGIEVAGRAFLTTTLLEEQVLSPEGALPGLVLAPLEMLRTWQDQSQIVMPMDSFIQNPDWGLTGAEIGDFQKVFWDEETNGERQGVPADRNVQLIFYNVTWAQALGFQHPPATPQEFEDQACAAMKANVADADPENNGTGGWILSTDPLVLESWRMVFGGDSLPAQESRAYIFNTQASVDAYSFLKKLVDKNCAWTARSPAPYPYFARRQALFYSGSLLDLSFQERAMDFAKSTDRWIVMEYPVPHGSPVVLTSGNTYAVLRSSAEAQLASWLFLRHLMLPRVQARISAASGLIPSRRSAVELMSDFRQHNLWWDQAAGWVDHFMPAPRLASWRTVRRILQDAAWQIFSPIVKVDGIPGVLQELDGMVKEITSRP